MKKCCKCFEIKELNEFHKDKSRSNGYSSRCKVCRSLHPTKTLDPFKVQVTREKLNKKRREDLETIEKNRKYKRQYYNKNKVSINIRERNRINSKLEARLAKQLRNRLGIALKNKSKKGSAVKDLGCSISEFIIYMESKFQPGMSWDNYGHKGWHIDHIIPLCKFNLEDITQFKQAAHYTNLQPLWAIDNLRKWKN